MAEVFVSYASDDRARVEPIVQAIEEAGFSVWWDRRIGLGSSFDREIERELNLAKCVVVVWSNQSIDSDWVRNEAQEGLERGVLVPLRIDNVKAPLAFRRAQTAFIKSDKPTSEDLAPVLSAIESACLATSGSPIAKGDRAPQQTVVTSRKSPLLWLVIGITIVITSLGITFWLFERSTTEVTRVEPSRTLTSIDRSIAVLSFSSLDSHKQSNSFSAALTQELRAAFTAYEELRTITVRTSSDSTDVTEASYVLDGSVQRLSDRILVRARLIRTSDRESVWARNFEQAVGEQLATPIELAKTVGRFVRLQLVQDERCESVRGKTNNEAASEAFCAALAENHRLNQGGDYDPQVQLRNAQRALDLNPDLAEGYGLVAAANFFLPFDTWQERSRTIHAALQKGFALDPDNPELLFYRGQVRSLLDLNYSSAQADFQKSLSLDPQHPYARWNHAGLGYIALTLGQTSESLEHYRRAVKVYDADSRIRFEYVAALVCAKLYREAINEADSALSLLSHGFYRMAILAYKGFALLALGDINEANALLDGAIASAPPGLRARFISTMALADRQQEALTMLAVVQTMKNPPPLVMALSYAALKDHDSSFDWLRECIDQRNSLVAFLRTHPIFDEMRQDPRWGDVIRHLETQEARASVSAEFEA